MSGVLTAAGWLAATYVTFTLAATGWAKLVTVQGTARALRLSHERLSPRAAEVGVLALATLEIGLALAGSIAPTRRFVALSCAALFACFAAYNTATSRRKSASEPCLCAGPTARALDASGYARATANILVCAACALWSVGVVEPIVWAQAGMLALCVAPAATWAARRAARPPERASSAA